MLADVRGSAEWLAERLCGVSPEGWCAAVQAIEENSATPPARRALALALPGADALRLWRALDDVDTAIHCVAGDAARCGAVPAQARARMRAVACDAVAALVCEDGLPRESVRALAGAFLVLASRSGNLLEGAAGMPARRRGPGRWPLLRVLW